MKRGPFRLEIIRSLLVKAIRYDSRDIRTIFFDRVFDAEPGQFVMVWIPGFGEKPFSISNMCADMFSIAVRRIGPATKRLTSPGTEDMFGVRGPFGRGFTLPAAGDKTADLLLVGGGMGIAPMEFLASRLAGRRFRMACAGKTAALIPRFVKPAGVEVRLATEDGTLGRKGLVTELAADMIDQRMPTCVCACGPEPMLVRVREMCEERNIDYQLCLERYMKCGIGVCGSCCLDGSGARVCVEGPVFDREALKSVTDLGRPRRGPTGSRQ